MFRILLIACFMVNVVIGPALAEGPDKSGNYRQDACLINQATTEDVVAPFMGQKHNVKTIIAEIVYPGATVEELEKIGDREGVLIEKRFWHEQGPDKSGNYRGDMVAKWRNVVAQFIGQKDAFADGQTTASVMVYIPKFTTSGMPQAGLDGLEMGGFWMDKYEASQPDASASSVGSTSTNSPGTTAAVSQQGVVAWHTINWANAKTSCQNRGRTKGPYNPSAAGTTTTIVDSVNFPAAMVGRHIVIVQGGVTYYARRITAYTDSTKTITFTPALPAASSAADTYTIYEYHLVTPYEWASVAYWCAMHTQPKGNNSYGNDTADSDADAATFGQLDPTEPSTSTTDRVLTGTGPRTWSHNQQSTGVWDLNGNVWEWVDLEVTANGTTIVITNGFPGAGYSIPTTSSYVNQLEDTDATVKTMAIPKTLGSANASYGNDYCWVTVSANTYAALRGGGWDCAGLAGVFSLGLNGAPSSTSTDLGFRAAR